MSVLETRQLTVEFDGFKAISNLDFKLKQGETRVIIGPNGAGKTTFIDLITGKVKPTKGEILFKSRDLSSMSSTDISLLGVGRKFQGPNVFGNLTVKQNIEIALNEKTNVLQALFKSKNKITDKKITEILTNINLISRKDVFAEILSHGEKQWLEIGMVLAQDPDLIILDEPTTGMTAEETYKTGELIHSLFINKTVIIVEHDMSFVRQIDSEITVLHQGELLAEGSLKSLEKNEEVQKVYLRND